MSTEIANRKATKEEIIAAIQACAAKLGHVPSQAEMQRERGINRRTLARQFGNYTKALRACGFNGQGPGFMLSMEELFKEWAGIVRDNGEVPSITECQLRSQHSCAPLRTRFGSWQHVPAGLLQYAEKNGLGEQWAMCWRSRDGMGSTSRAGVHLQAHGRAGIQAQKSLMTARFMASDFCGPL